jgi:hypothetical protein
MQEPRVMTGETVKYDNIILKKGVIPLRKPAYYTMKSKISDTSAGA